MMKLTFLGTGTSTGVPVIGCPCEVCKSTDPRDHRFRTAALLESETTRILIDCGPDIRMQLLKVPFKKIDAVLLTHEHYDHTGISTPIDRLWIRFITIFLIAFRNILIPVCLSST